MSLHPSLQTKYHCQDLNDLAKRVSTHVASNEKPCNQSRWQRKFESILQKKEFMPAGNTLAGSGTDKTLQPNCSVIGEINDENFESVKERSVKLWEKAIGIGFFVNSNDPIQTLEELSALNDGISLWENRPKRGNMAVVSIDHPKVLEVISYKSNQLLQHSNTSSLYNFNISIALTNEFMKQVIRKSNRKWKNSNHTAPELLEAISRHCHACGDPGVVFIDRVQNSSKITKDLGRIKAAVPCGEQFLHDNETCNLGVINLNAPSFFNENRKSFIWRRFKRVVGFAIRFLDDVVDLLEIPDEEMSRISKILRRVGLGVAGWADLLQKMSIPYDSKQALELADRMSRTFTAQARRQSAKLALEKGECIYRKGCRNISLTCIQPTGGITSILDNQGYCIEPFFNEANLLSVNSHIDMQAAWQNNIEQAISKTINMRNQACVKDIYDAYVCAYKKGCKGITIYRDGCRLSQPKKCEACEQDGVCPIIVKK